MHPFWCTIFGTARPVEIEIGPGTGTFILPAAHRCPETNFFGIEHSRARAAQLEAAIGAQALRNARVIAADAACVVSTFIPAASVTACHIYFPDPWWKRRHHRRRLFTPPFAAALAQTLVPGGRIFVATDVDDVFALMLRTLREAGGFTEDHTSRSPRATLTTFERKGLARGATIREASFVKVVAATPTRRPYTSRAAPITPAESPS